MSCCGQKRQQWHQENTRLQPAQVAAEPVLQDPVSLQYNGTNSHLVTGPKTGYLYLFAAKGNSLMVDSRDVPTLLAEAQKFSLV